MTEPDSQQPLGRDVIAACTPDFDVPPDPGPAVDTFDPCTIVIAGATGDLTARKLVPALFNLYLNDGLPDPFLIVGCGRTPLDDDAFRRVMGKRPGINNHPRWPQFAATLHYRSLDYHDPGAYHRLAQDLKDLDRQWNAAGNRVFYFALPPALYQPVARSIGQAGLAAEGENGNGWSRVVVEKPFGHNLKSAVDLDHCLHEYFGEHQIFRIDHYLAKETVQNILMFRFANAIFEPIWNRRYIEYVNITAIETLGVEKRAGYYEQAGVLRDMFQNHMMQLLALTAMEPPSLFEADQVRDEKAKVYRALRPFPVDNLQSHLVLGQYAAGTIDGKRVAAYRKAEGVDPHSLIPTFASMKVFLDNWRWQGVPFYLTSGKRLDRKVTEIAIQFKAVPHSMFRQALGEAISPNRLTLGIYPDEKITLTFQTKNPGARLNLRSVTMDFDYLKNSTGPTREAYEKVLLDCMLGDQMLFWRQDGVELCWGFLTPILSGCEMCGDRKEMLHFYASGSRGPRLTERAADRLASDDA